MTGWKVDEPVKSAISERVKGWRRSDFEKKMTRAMMTVSKEILMLGLQNYQEILGQLVD